VPRRKAKAIFRLQPGSLKASFKVVSEDAHPVYICLCHAATTRDVDTAIEDGAATIEEVGEACGAGTGCGSCHEEIQERLEACGVSDDDRPRGCPRSSLVSVSSLYRSQPQEAA
jgi:bacterioferritin-associated ferredoxin